MKYAQLNEAMDVATELATDGPIQWDANNFCTAEALTKDELAEQFRVVPLAVIEPPVFDPITHSLQRSGCELVGESWQYKWTVTALPVEQVSVNIAALKATRVVAIKVERDRRKFNGVFVSGKWIHSDTYSRTQWMGMVMMGASVPSIPWTTMDNSSITTSQALAGAVFQGIAQMDATLFAYAKSLIDAVEASNDPASIDITTGWPATFGEVA